MAEPSRAAPRVLGRYMLCEEIASGGMATVHLGRLMGSVGFSRTVAVKRLHPQFAKDPQFVAMFLDEARLAARIRHPNVVPTLDVVAISGELFLVMEYVHGESLFFLLKASRARREPIPAPIGAAILSAVLQGLHAAHQAKTERGTSLEIVHRDVSPQNILVGADGVARVFDFGVAKAIDRFHTTREGELKGKLPYMAPEQVRSQAVTRKTDIFAASVVLWETLTGKRLFRAESAAGILDQIMNKEIPPPSKLVPEIPPGLDEVVLKGLMRDPNDRFATANDMSRALERAAGLVSPREVGDWVETVSAERLEQRARRVAEVESRRWTEEALESGASDRAGLGLEASDDDTQESGPTEAPAPDSEQPPAPAAAASSAAASPAGTATATPIDASPWTREPETSSQVSSISRSETILPKRRDPPLRLGAAAGAILGLSVGGVLAWYLYTGSSHPPEKIPPAAALAPATTEHRAVVPSAESADDDAPEHPASDASSTASAAPEAADRPPATPNPAPKGAPKGGTPKPAGPASSPPPAPPPPAVVPKAEGAKPPPLPLHGRE